MAAAFRLATLLRLRTMQEDQAAAELGRANGEAHAARRRVEATTRRLAEAGVPDGMTASAWRAVAASRAALRRDVEAAGAVALAAAATVAERERQWQDARARTRPYERLEERHVEQTTAAELAAEQLALDEAAGRSRAPQAPGTTSDRGTRSER